MTNKNTAAKIKTKSNTNSKTKTADTETRSTKNFNLPLIARIARQIPDDLTNRFDCAPRLWLKLSFKGQALFNRVYPMVREEAILVMTRNAKVLPKLEIETMAEIIAHNVAYLLVDDISTNMLESGKLVDNTLRKILDELVK